MKIVECIPNFSEGQNKATLHAIADSISSVKGVQLLHQSTGISANRTVFTFIGEKDAVFEAAFNSIEVANRLIDMRKQKGTHPRIGACDVCPFVPISGISMEELVEETKVFAQKVNNIFEIPVYLYEMSASESKRKNLAFHRIGNFEKLEERIIAKKSVPDYGKTFNTTFGGLVTGARNLLVAYNINLNTKDPKLAQEIAYDLRELGRPIKKENGKTIYQPGQLKAVKAIGWFIPEYDLAQVSINLIDYKITPIHVVYETTRKLAHNYGIELKGSELIGLIPKQTLLEAGHFYLKNSESKEKEILEEAIKKLGLASLEQFDMKKRILELAINA